MYFAPPIDYDKVMKRVPYGKVITHRKNPGIFLPGKAAEILQSLSQPGFLYSIAAWASYQRAEDETPYWRTLKGQWRAECKISRGYRDAERKAGSREDISLSKKGGRI